MPEEKLLEAIEELRIFMEHAQDAATRLKQDIPSEDFPIAYQMSNTIRSLRKTIDELRHQIAPDAPDYTMRIFETDMLSGSDSMIGH